jgi:hypothetical protein
MIRQRPLSPVKDVSPSANFKNCILSPIGRTYCTTVLSFISIIVGEHWPVITRPGLARPEQWEKGSAHNVAVLAA